MKVFIAIFIMTLSATEAEAAEKWSAEHICSPQLSNVEILDCMVQYFESIESQRLTLEVEQVADINGNESRKAFENYREEECLRQRISMGGASMAGHMQVGCKIKLTEQRIGILNNDTEATE